MKVLILGSGVIGVTSAYYLARAGHEVTVVDRQSEPALETSFANAGEVSPGYSSPWAGPGVPVKAVKWLLMKHGPLVVRPKLDPVMWVWLLKMLRNCTSARYAVNKSRMIPIAEYSRDSLRDLRRDIGIQYDERSQGTLQLFRYQAQLDGTAEDIAVLKQYGVPFEVLSREGCIAVEPALSGVKEKFVGGLRLPQDETGDCHMFTQALAKHAQALGVRFMFNTSIDRIVTDGARVSGVVTSAGTLQADSYVLALGSWSSRLAAPLGISLPVYPVKGYSITVPIKDASGAPESTVMDESYKVAITRLGDRIRVGGTAEISGYSDKLYDARRATLDHSLTDLFPRGGDLAKATFWSGLRPMTPDGPPVIGPTQYANLHLNTGHGTLGWTMSCGSGRVLADLLSGRKPDIDVSALTVDRYNHRFG
ncbi:D-amino acid dehydrogenase [Bradyrhizobium diazoefficiens]|nr:D-amino acid dehydrogenase [Bradyrhizobium diazoefficiens]MBR0772603.1 D-amino acid dehydrogenase [Bradyrhizobium diazoefficiens]